MTEQTDYRDGLCVGSAEAAGLSAETGLQELRGVPGYSMLYAAVENILNALRHRGRTDSSAPVDDWSDPICS